MEQPLISIITVVYNGAHVIADTLQSAVNQTYKHIELIIVDGASKDGTVDVLEPFRPYISTLISEPDRGIYDAMNKGIRAAKGEWLYFLNAGDVFYDDRVLEDLFAKQYLSAYRLIYGKVKTVNEPSGIDYLNGHPVTFRDFYYSYPICHQATFTHLKAFEETGMFNDSLRINADNEWQIRFFKTNAAQALYTDRIIAYYDVQGASYHKRMFAYREFLSYIPAYFPWFITLYNYAAYPLLWLKVKIIRTFQGTAWFKAYRKLKFRSSL